MLSDHELNTLFEYLGVSPRTVDGDWSMARAWLKRELHAN